MPGDQFFGTPQVHEIRLKFSQPGYLDSLKANYALDAYMRCEVTIDGAAYPASGAKYKGNSSYNNGSRKKPFRLDLAEYVDGQAHDGLKKLVLNNGFKDPTLLREKLTLDFLNEHGITAPRATFARLYLNDRYWGLYTVIEDVNKTFLEDRFGNKKGNLFKGDQRGSLVWKGWSQAAYLVDYELKTNETENDWSDLLRLLNALNNTPAAALPDSLDRYMNVASWLSYWAAQSLFVNLDSYVGSGHNYFIYHNADTDKFDWIAWDVNEAFGNFNMGIQPQGLKNLPFTHIPQPFEQRPLMNRMLQNPAYKQALADRLCQLLQDFDNARLDPKIDALAALIRPDVLADTLKFYSNAQFEQNLSQDIMAGGGGPAGGFTFGLKSFVSGRRASLAQQLAAYGCVPTSATEALENQAVEIFPNPASHVFWAKASGASLEKIALLALDGRVLRRWAVAPGAQQMECSLADIAPGIYVVETVADGRRRAAKLVVE